MLPVEAINKQIKEVKRIIKFRTEELATLEKSKALLQGISAKKFNQLSPGGATLAEPKNNGYKTTPATKFKGKKVLALIEELKQKPYFAADLATVLGTSKAGVLCILARLQAADLVTRGGAQKPFVYTWKG